MMDNSIPYNLLIVGSKGVGKFSLHNQLVHGLFPSVYDPFFDDPAERNIRECRWTHSEGRKSAVFRVNPQRDDIGRPGEYREFPGYHNINGMVLVYRINSTSSFQALEQWVAARKAEHGGVLFPKPLVLVGNMSDVKRRERKILGLEAEELAAKLGCAFVECSSKDGKGIEKVKAAALKRMAMQKDELISIELGIIPRRRAQTIRPTTTHSIAPARLQEIPAVEPRKSFSDKFSVLRVLKKKKSASSIRSKTTINPQVERSRRNSLESAYTALRNNAGASSSTLQLPLPSPAPSSIASFAESARSPASIQGRFANGPRHSATSSVASAISHSSNEDRALYPLDEEYSRPTSPESDDFDLSKVNSRTPRPILSDMQRQMLRAHESLMEDMSQAYNVAFLHPDDALSVRHGFEPITAVSGRSSIMRHANESMPNLSATRISTVSSFSDTTSTVMGPPPALPLRSPRRTSIRPMTAMSDYIPAPLVPLSRQSSHRSGISARSEISLSRVDLPILSPADAAIARQNILAQLANLMQSQSEHVSKLVHPAFRDTTPGMPEAQFDFSMPSTPLEARAPNFSADGRFPPLSPFSKQTAEEREKTIESLPCLSTGHETFGREQAGLWRNTAAVTAL